MKKLIPISQSILTFCLIVLLIPRAFFSYIPEPLRNTIWNLWSSLTPILSLILLSVLCVGIIFLQNKQRRRSFCLVPLGVMGLLVTVGASAIGLEYPAKLHSTVPSLAVRVPLDGDVVVAWGGDDVRKNYHAAYPDQRWAYDLVVEPHSLGSNLLEDYGCYGKTVLAPVSGEIKTAHDGEIDRVPDENAEPLNNVFGNYIVMQPDGQNTRLIVAHLKQNSISVKRGDRVEEGHPIALCGNSGNTTEPHIHIHLVAMHEQGDALTLTGLPLYFRDNSGPRMPIGGFRMINGRSVASGDNIKHQIQ